MIWREKRVLLVILGVLLAANVVYFFTYRVQFQRRVDSFDERLEQAQSQLESARLARLRTERTYQAYRQIDRDTKAVFEEHWSTRPRRFTMLVAEVKRLTAASSMTPPRIGFGMADASVQETMKTRGAKAPDIGAKEVNINFTVTGSYEQVRRLINLLELSRQFVIINQIALSHREGEELTLNLNLKTLFREEQELAANDRL